jgi:hypothetical protein
MDHYEKIKKEFEEKREWDQEVEKKYKEFINIQKHYETIEKTIKEMIDNFNNLAKEETKLGQIIYFFSEKKKITEGTENKPVQFYSNYGKLINKKGQIMKKNFEEIEKLFESLQFLKSIIKLEKEVEPSLIEFEYQISVSQNEYIQTLIKLVQKYQQFYISYTDDSLKEVHQQVENTEVESKKEIKFEKKQIFGVKINDLNDKFPPIIGQVLEYIEKNCLNLEDIFRNQGDKNIIKIMKENLEIGVPFEEMVREDYKNKSHNLVCLIKIYLKELKDEIIPIKQLFQFIEEINSNSVNLEKMKQITNSLPTINKIILIRFLRFFGKFKFNTNIVTTEIISILFSRYFIKISDNFLLKDNLKFINELFSYLIDNINQIAPTSEFKDDTYNILFEEDIQHSNKLKSILLNNLIKKEIEGDIPQDSINQNTETKKIIKKKIDKKINYDSDNEDLILSNIITTKKKSSKELISTKKVVIRKKTLVIQKEEKKEDENENKNEDLEKEKIEK